MKFLETLASLSGVLMLIWVGTIYWVGANNLAPNESTNIVMWLGVWAIFAGFSIYCFKLLNGNHRAQMFAKTFIWCCVFLPPFGNCLLRVVLAAFGIDSSTDHRADLFELANASVVSVFFLLLINWRMFFACPFWRSGVAAGLLMFCCGFLCELSMSESAEIFLSRVTKNIGKSSGEIERLVGKPIAIEGPITLKGWPVEAANCDKNFVYEFAHTHVLVSFRNDRCASAQLYDSALHFKYQCWKADRAKAIANGKTREAILKSFGKPASIEITEIPCQLVEVESWSQLEDNTREAILKVLNKPSKISEAPCRFVKYETWSYNGTEFGTGIHLKIQNGACTGFAYNETYGGGF